MMNIRDFAILDKKVRAKEANRRYKLRNPEKVKKWNSGYRERNRERIRQRAREYRKQHPLTEEEKQIRSIKYRERYTTDMAFRMYRCKKAIEQYYKNKQKKYEEENRNS